MLEIRLLGPLEVRCDGHAVEVSGSRARSLLAILALAAGRSLSSEILLQRCWGQPEPTDPKATLHTAVRRLRVLLGSAAILTTRQGYALQIDPQHVDAVTFTRLLEPGSGADQIDTALALWRGEPFIGDYSDWLAETERTRLVQLWLSAVERRADIALAADRPAAVVGELQDLVNHYPLRESLWARLLLALRASGRTAEALERYGTIRGRIIEELGVEPGSELRRIFQQLLGDDTDPDTTLPLPQQLPLDVGHFLGRGGELKRLQELLAGPPGGPTTIACITGPAGAGKTALAVRWAHRAREHFPDGQLYLDLRGFGPTEPVSADAALETFLLALNIPADRIPATTPGRTALLRSAVAGRRILLVLDNARNADQIRPFLPGEGGRVLVTSRNQLPGLLARDGAARIELGGLDERQAIDLLAGGRTISEPETAEELVALCGGLPLPLRVIAERLGRDPELSLADVLQELRDERLDAFPDQDEASDLRAVFSWSYQTLPEEPARIFRLLGAYPHAEFGVEVAAALAGTDTRAARRQLDWLIGMSLLQKRSRRRYRFHDLIGTYAAELSGVDAAEAAAARHRMQQWFLHTMIEAEQAAPAPLIPPPPIPRPDGLPLPEFHDHADRRQWFDTEQAAALAVIDEAVAAGEDEFVCTAGRPLLRLLWSRQRWNDQVAFARTLRVAAQRAGEATAEFLAVQALANAAADTGDHADAALWQNELLKAARKIENPEYEMLAVATIGVNHAHAREFAEAIEPLSTALAISQESNRPAITALYQCYLAFVYTNLGRHEEALALGTEALERQRELEDETFVVDTLSTLGDTLLALGRIDEAIARYQQSIAVAGPHGGDVSRAQNLLSLGDAFRAAGRPEEARRAWQQAHDIYASFDHPHAAAQARMISERLES
ncbi:MAG TPA: BTAD domain-containing putative transcriptional regulator [Mycobacteriales bacterium]|nr:BTAD domain-containing putative transcriptional regulator [Mycobacteriales bacterium]